MTIPAKAPRWRHGRTRPEVDATVVVPALSSYGSRAGARPAAGYGRGVPFASLGVSAGSAASACAPFGVVPAGVAVPIEAVPIEAVPIEAVPVEAVPVEAVPVEAVPDGVAAGLGSTGPSTAARSASAEAVSGSAWLSRTLSRTAARIQVVTTPSAISRSMVSA